VEAEFLLEADEFEEAARHAHEFRSRLLVVALLAPPAVGDGVELVLQPDDRAVVVEGAVPEFVFDDFGVGLRLRSELRDVDVEDRSDLRRQVAVRTTPCTVQRLESDDSDDGSLAPRAHALGELAERVGARSE
jgi:hypothetical protein